MRQAQDVVVIGGGISGTAAAYELARAGANVTLLERGELAAMASGWTLAGVRQSGRHPAEIPLAIAAVERWGALAEELGADVEYRREGNLRLARTAEEVPLIREMVAEQRALGLELEYLPDNAAVRAVAPALSETVLSASFCPSDGHANPHLAVQAFAAAAIRAGATIRTGVEVTGIDVRGGRVRGVQTTAGPVPADAVAVTAGVYTPRLLAPLGIELPIEVRQAAIVQSTLLPPLLAPVLGVANGDVALRQQADGRLRLTGASVDWDWPEGQVSAEDVQPPALMIAGIIERCAAVLPVAGTARINRVWGGLLDMTPDALPVIESVPEIEGLVIAAGFSGHGFCLGPATGRIVRELVTRGEATLPIDAFQRGRFAGEVVSGPKTLHG